ncbi:MAG: hypothetical protein HKN82_10265 [Akkermansiaceae bacterium]|nr:hypothetical protein [Akkermansiaceae bacterium]NNM30093.1 hypothetical protein [Akkermansiaceae bacterium]
MKRYWLLLPASLVLTGCGSFVGYIFENPNARPTVSLSYPGGRNVLAAGHGKRLRQEAIRAKRRGDFEVCGSLMMNAEGKIDLIYGLNEARESHAYLMSQESIARMRQIAKLTNRRIIGSFHSHPTTYAIPSRVDVSTAQAGSLMLIHSVPTGRTRLWQLSDFDGVLLPEELPLEIESLWKLPPAERGRREASRPDAYVPSEVEEHFKRRLVPRAVPVVLPARSKPVPLPPRDRVVPLRSAPRAIPVPMHSRPEVITPPPPVAPRR